MRAALLLVVPALGAAPNIGLQGFGIGAVGVFDPTGQCREPTLASTALVRAMSQRNAGAGIPRQTTDLHVEIRCRYSGQRLETVSLKLVPARAVSRGELDFFLFAGTAAQPGETEERLLARLADRLAGELVSVWTKHKWKRDNAI